MPDINPEWQRDSAGYFTIGSALENENGYSNRYTYHVWRGVKYIYATKLRISTGDPRTIWDIVAVADSSWSEEYHYYENGSETSHDTITRGAGTYTSNYSIYDRIANAYVIPTMPIFEYGDTESINNYINNGDISGAINADEFAEKFYAKWTVAYTNAEDTNYSVAVDCPQFYDSSSDFYGKNELASMNIEVAMASDVAHPFYKNTISYGTTWNGSLMNLLANGDTSIATRIQEKVLSLLDVDHIRITFWISFYDSSIPGQRESTHGYVVFDHAEVEDYGFVGTPATGDEITFKAGAVLDDTDSDVSNNTPDPETSDTVDSEDVANVTGGNLLTRTYAMTPQEVQGIGAFLWGATFMQDIKLLNSSPIENIVTCKLFPFELSGTDKNVFIGNVDSGTQSKQVDKTVVKFESNSFTVPKYYSNLADNLKFLDYAPYTKVELFLPFIGMKELPIDLCMGKAIKIVWLVDLICGTLQTDVYLDGKCLIIYNSQIGVDIPLTAQNLAQVQSAYIQNAIGGGISLASGNAVGAISSIVASATTQYHSQSSGSPAPCTALHGILEPYVIITRTLADTIGDVENSDHSISHCKMYRSVVGAPCYEVGPLGNYHGYTEVENARVAVNGALREEVEEINRLLESGVILP